jgi:hypothetical protein
LQGLQPGPLCLPLSLNLEDMDALDEIVKRGRPLKKASSCSARVTISARFMQYAPAP